jgi:hypothetical protein
MRAAKGEGMQANTLTELIIGMKNKFWFTYNQPPTRVLIPPKVIDRLEEEVERKIEDGDIFANMSVFVVDDYYIIMDRGRDELMFSISMPDWHTAYVTRGEE